MSAMDQLTVEQISECHTMAAFAIEQAVNHAELEDGQDDYLRAIAKMIEVARPFHVIEIYWPGDTWAIMHTLLCRPDLLGCEYHRAVTRDLADMTRPVAHAGRYRLDLDSAGHAVIGERIGA
jgi:hypothetical protein